MIDYIFIAITTLLFALYLIFDKKIESDIILYMFMWMVLCTVHFHIDANTPQELKDAQEQLMQSRGY